MKRSVFFLFIICAISISAFGMGGPAQAGGDMPNIYLFDTFEDGNYSTSPEWWKFDNIALHVVDNSDYPEGDPNSLSNIGNYSISITGTCTDWYCGGLGVYTAKKGMDMSKYNTFMMDVYGNGPGSGTVKIELNDDDNGNWVPEQDPKKNFANMYDDKWIYNLTVDWRGWKRVQIPIADFVDENPGIGDDIWNPSQEGGSGGLIQMQLIFIGAKRAGSIRMNLDNIGLAVK